MFNSEYTVSLRLPVWLNLLLSLSRLVWSGFAGALTGISFGLLSTIVVIGLLGVLLDKSLRFAETRLMRGRLEAS
jgi:hypothetical protein